MSTNEVLGVAIIGAGFAGIGLAIRLKQEGDSDFEIFEAGPGVGGTWRVNTYPGCACDVPSHLYSYSFEPRPTWSRAFSPQKEILSYIEHCVEKHQLAPKIQFNTAITSSKYDEENGWWILERQGGEDILARFVVMATGPLAKPQYPPISGRERFQGASFHSARWDHGYDLEGKNVAVIGTGASAIQFVPQIAPHVKKLTLFQRTPPWILPRKDRAFESSEKARFSRFPRLHRAYRNALYWRHEVLAFPLTLKPALLEHAAKQGRAHIRSAIDDPALRELVTPDYVPGCKRVLISNDYYPALARENVEVVADPIQKISESCVVAGGHEHEVDAIIYGTGFDVSAFMSGMTVTGRGGVSLKETWRERIGAYYGLCVTGFPNMFMLAGPNTGLGHNSIIFMIEAQVHWLLKALSETRRRRATRIEVTHDAQEAFNERIRKRLVHTVWQSGCASWYLDDNGNNFTLWPGTTAEYWARTRRFDADDFTLT